MVVACDDVGNSETAVESCDTARGIACRDGQCVNLCAAAAQAKSNVGCEYWGVDLDNAVISATLNAAAQQYAIVVSNPQPDVSAHVIVEQDDSEPGQLAQRRTVAEADVLPLNLETFKLGPREVDGSPDGQFNTGTGTALTRHAYRVESDVPIVAFQFNPLDNVNVFSNDASLLKPTAALTTDPGVFSTAYVVLSWPQTIGWSGDPEFNFDAIDTINLRAFLAVVGTRPDTQVRVTTRARVIPGGPVKDTPALGTIDAVLQPFDVLNLETGETNADFTGSLIEADQPVVVFPGSEASDAPVFDSLSKRFCCADHLEQQLDPIRTAGKSFVLAHMPSRTRAVRNAGANIGVVDEPEFYRVMSVSSEPVEVSTSLPAPDNAFRLAGRGDFRQLTTLSDATLDADGPVLVMDIQAGQEAAHVPRGLPGGDPSLVVVPPVEQYRPGYVFLTPDKYVFDAVLIMAPKEAEVLLDDQPIDGRCDVDHLSRFDVFSCQLSFPLIQTGPGGTYAVMPGRQDDGVHRVVSNMDVGVLVVGWDSYVSYGYAAGTRLEEINPVR
jgi:hypothetical protein